MEMGVDIYLSSVFDPFFESFKASGEPERVAQSYDDPTERIEALFDAYRKSGGYFRNAYNGTDVMAAMGLSWGMVYDEMCDENGRLPVERARELVALIEAKPWTRALYAERLLHHGDGPIEKLIAKITGEPAPRPVTNIDAFFTFASEKREQLLAILRKSIDLNEPLLVDG